MSFYLEQLEDISPLTNVLQELAGIEDFEAYRFCDDFADEHKRYEVFKILSPRGVFVLKRFENQRRFAQEQEIYQRFSPELPIPRVLGFSDGFMLMEYLEGKDLKEMSDESAYAAALSVAELMNAFPLSGDYDRSACEKEIEIREKRLACLAEKPVLHAAYTLFLERLRNMPLCFAHNDFVPLNCLYTGERVYILDWEYGAFLPYALDLGRFLAHAGEEAAFPYRMTEKQKEIFLTTIYAKLREKPEKNVYERDVMLAVLDECVMVLKYYYEHPDDPKDESFFAYERRALALAGALTRGE